LAAFYKWIKLMEVYLEKHNETYCYVHAERAVLKEIHEHFSFYVDGYKFMPKYKNRYLGWTDTPIKSE